VNYALRLATPGDAALLAQHRARVWHEVGDWDEALLIPQIPIWSAWFHDAVGAGTYVSFVAEEDGAAVASGSLLIHVAIPRPGFDSDREGRVQSVYVVPAARRRGIARALMDAIVAHARDARLIRLTLHPSDEARTFYEQLGFDALDEMGLRLTGERT
jgi:GNAT superfamily N-acetyltransferase